ncbi:MAG: 50S ribosomal protein L24 [Clostridia bacterium]|nr:50S ribosomal protein L24 [Clostridia bacterium]
MSKMHIKKDDRVIVISGKYANMKEPSIGKVIAVSPKEGKVIVEGVHMVSKHVKPRRQGEAGGIIKTEGAIYACKVMLYCDKCKAGRRVRHQINENGERVRVCVKCGENL